MKKHKNKKGKNASITKPKPYTVKQENDIVIGKVLCWCFILSFPAIGLLTLIIHWKIKICLLLWSIISILFATYNFLGLIFKWDHARICSKLFIKKGYKFDIRNAWTKEDKKDSISLIVAWSIMGVILLVWALFHSQ